MGRKSHNKTYIQLLDEGRRRANEYYKMHRLDVLKKKREQYRKLKDAKTTNI